MVSWTLSIRTPLRRTTAPNSRGQSLDLASGRGRPSNSRLAPDRRPADPTQASLRGLGPLTVHGVHAVWRHCRVLHFRIGAQQAENTLVLVLPARCEVDRGWIVDGAAARGESPET